MPTTRRKQVVAVVTAAVLSTAVSAQDLRIGLATEPSSSQWANFKAFRPGLLPS